MNHELLHYLQRLLRGTRDDRLVADLDDRPLKQRRVLDDRLYDVTRCRLRRQPEFLCLSFAFAKDLKWRNSQFPYQVPERFLSERFVKVIDPLDVDAVFTKQRGQISARRSGRFFVDGDFLLCHVLSQCDLRRVNRHVS